MNLGLGLLWSIPTLVLLILGFFLIKKSSKIVKSMGIVSLACGGVLLVSVMMLFLDMFEV